jgi:hypothetical protein
MAAVTSLMRAQAIVQAGVDDVVRPLNLSFARHELLMLLSKSALCPWRRQEPGCSSIRPA